VSAEAPHGPTSGAKPEPRSHGDAAPPLPPHELPRPQPVEREFEADGRSWVARLSGKGAYGTGGYGLGLVDAVHFADPAEPGLPLREALLAHGRFHDLFDAELIDLLHRSTPIAHPEHR
jgi:hypothetical protein